MIDLHLHLDGSLPIETLRNLAKRQGLEVSCEQIIRECVAPPNCNNLNRYLNCFELPLNLLQTQWALRYAMAELMTCDKLRGHKYVEVRFAPQLHTRQGLTQEQAVDELIKAIIETKTECVFRLILCAMRGGEYQDNLTTICLASQYQGIVAGVDLAGAEGLFATKDYRDLFKIAANKGLNITVHAGEASGEESVRAAIEMGAKRIGHGIAIANDEDLMDTIKRQKIGIEMCPKSNLDTKAVNSLKNYPIDLFLKKGLLVTVNTDNLTVSSTDMNNEYSILLSAGIIDKKGIQTAQNNAEIIKFG